MPTNISAFFIAESQNDIYSRNAENHSSTGSNRTSSNRFIQLKLVLYWKQKPIIQ